jgi:hypothetical protein
VRCAAVHLARLTPLPLVGEGASRRREEQTAQPRPVACHFCLKAARTPRVGAWAAVPRERFVCLPEPPHPSLFSPLSPSLQAASLLELPVPERGSLDPENAESDANKPLRAPAWLLPGMESQYPHQVGAAGMRTGPVGRLVVNAQFNAVQGL